MTRKIITRETTQTKRSNRLSPPPVLVCTKQSHVYLIQRYLQVRTNPKTRAYLHPIAPTASYTPSDLSRPSMRNPRLLPRRMTRNKHFQALAGEVADQPSLPNPHSRAYLSLSLLLFLLPEPMFPAYYTPEITFHAASPACSQDGDT